MIFAGFADAQIQQKNGDDLNHCNLGGIFTAHIYICIHICMYIYIYNMYTHFKYSCAYTYYCTYTQYIYICNICEYMFQQTIRNWCRIDFDSPNISLFSHIDDLPWMNFLSG